MEISSQRLTQPLSVPLCQDHFRHAEAAAERQSDAAIARQVKDNLLATFAAQYYLKLISQPSQVSEVAACLSDCFEPEKAAIALRRGGHLLLSAEGQHLRCLPLRVGRPWVHYPAEKMGDPRCHCLGTHCLGTYCLGTYCLGTLLGTLAIEIDLLQHEAKIWGFVPGNPLHHWCVLPGQAETMGVRSLHCLIDCLSQIPAQALPESWP